MIVKKQIHDRFLIVLVFLLVAMMVVLSKVVGIQYIEGNHYRRMAQELTIKNDTIYAKKGNVISSDGSMLATSMSRYNVFMDPVTVSDRLFSSQLKPLSDSLSVLFGKPSNQYYLKIKNARTLKKRYIKIARNISHTEFLRLKKFPIFNKGLYKGGLIVDQKVVRAHPFGEIAERTIGYKDYRGGVGLEGCYSDVLKGSHGWRLKQKIAKNQWKPINDNNEREPEDGCDVVTTIDLNIQDVAHHALKSQLEKFDADHGCVVVMEANTGRVKAIANLGRDSEGNYYEKRNYAVWETAEPGSTFKTASLMVGLEHGLIDTARVVDTGKGILNVFGYKVEDSHKGGFGKISLAKALEVSSNVAIVKAIKSEYQSNPEKFVQALKDLGFHKPLGLSIKGEGVPFLPDPSHKQWSRLYLSWMSWGYGISMTPLQMLTFYNAIANNGVMVKPRFVEALVGQGGELKKTFETEIINSKIASDETLSQLRKVLENTVKRGTAKNIYSPYFSMAGKTGTAKKYIKETLPNGKTRGYYSNRHYIASFAGFFPAENPTHSCIVVVHDPNVNKGYYGATVAAPVFEKVAKKINAIKPRNVEVAFQKSSSQYLEKSYSGFTEKISAENRLPNVKGMLGMDAISLLENMGYEVRYTGRGKVVKQSLGSKNPKNRKSIVHLKLQCS